MTIASTDPTGIRQDRQAFSETPIVRPPDDDPVLMTVDSSPATVTDRDQFVPSPVADLELFTRAEVAALLKIKPSWLRDNQTKLGLPHTCVGRQVRYSKADIAAIAAMGRVAPVAVPMKSTTMPPMELTPIPKRRRPPS
jgi:hypothetical protein